MKLFDLGWKLLMLGVTTIFGFGTLGTVLLMRAAIINEEYGNVIWCVIAILLLAGATLMTAGLVIA